MSDRKSLYNAGDFGGSSAKKSGGGGGMDSRDKVKAGAAIALLIVAGILLAYNFDLLPSFGESGASEPDPELQEAIQRQEEELERLDLDPTQMIQGDS